MFKSMIYVRSSIRPYENCDIVGRANRNRRSKYFKGFILSGGPNGKGINHTGVDLTPNLDRANATCTDKNHGRSKKTSPEGFHAGASPMSRALPHPTTCIPGAGLFVRHPWLHETFVWAACCSPGMFPAVQEDT